MAKPIFDFRMSPSTPFTLEEDGSLLSGTQVNVEIPQIPRRYHYSGWQSWSLTTWATLDRHLFRGRPAILLPMQTDPCLASESKPCGSWYGAVEMANHQILLLGALGLDSQVCLSGQSLIGQAETEQDWFVSLGTELEVFSRYAKRLMAVLAGQSRKHAGRVWCSWYSLKTLLDEAKMRKVVRELADLSFDVIQIDDGWQVGIGSWEANGKFPHGMESLAEQIQSTHRKAGLWLAPLVTTPSTKLFQAHPEWLLHDQHDRLVSAGFNWGEPLYALDTTHPAVLAWLDQLMKKVRSWGYEYVKLDFLYAGALPGKRHLAMTREAAYRLGLKTLYDALGDAYLLACGAPILPSVGLCDGLRVGADVSATWNSYRDDHLLENHAIPGAQNALRTSVNRLWLQELVETDPDVVFFRSKGVRLSGEQKQWLQDLARAARFKACSDIPSWLTPGERTALQHFLEAKEVIDRRSATIFQIDGREIDFSIPMELPRPPERIVQLIGSAAGRMANHPKVLRVLDRIDKHTLGQFLDKNPV
jgi:alpha-galactosidase